jgi:NAD(P)-dependent dehydrogenase (short-subunit alcohol dehydrogenase family)
MPATWLITGATSGFGRLIADRAIRSGAHVIAVGRRADRLADLARSAPEGYVTSISMDITGPDAQRRLTEVIESVGGLDVLVNNAGYGLFGSVEQTGDEAVRAVLETNVLANLAVVRAALPALRASRGRIVQLSSLIGQFVFPGSGLYSASKAAVELLSEALAQELAPAGVRVTIIEPGTFATEFLTTSHVVAPDEIYAPTVGESLARFSTLSPEAIGSPELVADVIVAVVGMDEPPLRLAVGEDAVAGIRASLESRLAELDKWARIAIAQDA